MYYTGKECPNCHNMNCQLISETSTSGKDFSASKGCCGYILFGAVGLLCGLCGEGRKQQTRSYWVCPNCNHKFSV